MYSSYSVYFPFFYMCVLITHLSFYLAVSCYPHLFFLNVTRCHESSINTWQQLGKYDKTWLTSRQLLYYIGKKKNGQSLQYLDNHDSIWAANKQPLYYVTSVIIHYNTTPVHFSYLDNWIKQNIKTESIIIKDSKY